MKQRESSKLVNIRMSEDLYERLKDCADEDRRTMSDFLRRALETYLERIALKKQFINRHSNVI